MNVSQISKLLADAGVTEDEIAATQCDDPMYWDTDMLVTLVADYRKDEARIAVKVAAGNAGAIRRMKIANARIAALGA